MTIVGWNETEWRTMRLESRRRKDKRKTHDVGERFQTVQQLLKTLRGLVLQLDSLEDCGGLVGLGCEDDVRKSAHRHLLPALLESSDGVESVLTFERGDGCRQVDV